jgi:hypothetical protein
MVYKTSWSLAKAAAVVLAGILLGCVIFELSRIVERAFSPSPLMAEQVRPETFSEYRTHWIFFPNSEWAKILCRDGLYADLGEGADPRYMCFAPQEHDWMGNRQDQ